jgi:hypothetical protein
MRDELLNEMYLIEILLPVRDAPSGQDGFGFCHRAKFSERDMSWQMVEAAGTGYDGLLRSKPTVRSYPVGNQLPALDVRSLHIDRADAQLFITE